VELRCRKYSLVHYTGLIFTVYGGSHRKTITKDGTLNIFDYVPHWKKTLEKNTGKKHWKKTLDVLWIMAF